MTARAFLDTAVKVVATTLSQAPVTRTVVGPWRIAETSALEFAQAHQALYARD